MSPRRTCGSWSRTTRLLPCFLHLQRGRRCSRSFHTAIADVPYLALASKADIKTVFGSIYEASDVANISQKDIREYVARIFEFKKPIKQDILSELNESYGINVQNLKFVPTFSNLAKAQSVLFEALAATSEKDSVVRDVFESFAKTLRKKGGIQTLDVNDFIFETFQAAEELDVSQGCRSRHGCGELLEAKDKKKLDPVGKEDGDVDNEVTRRTDKYLKNRRDAIGKAMGKKKVGKKKMDKEMEKEDEEDDQTRTDESEQFEPPQVLGSRHDRPDEGTRRSVKEIDWDALSDDEEDDEQPEEEANLPYIPA